MPKLSEIVTQINTDLITNQFKGRKFQKGAFKGIAELVRSSKEGETKPGIVADDGQVTKVTIDDTMSFLAYHRVMDVENEDIPGFGDLVYVKETATIKLVMYADRRKVKITKEQMMSGISLGMPREFSLAFRDSLNIRGINVELGSFETDKSVVWSSEFGIDQALYKPNTILISYTYQIVTETKSDCFILCT